MNAEPAQMVPASGWTGGRMLGVDRVYQVVAGEVLQPLPKESRFGFVDDALWRARGHCHVRPFYLSIADGGRNPQLEYQCVRVVLRGQSSAKVTYTWRM